MIQELSEVLGKNGCEIYPKSLRTIKGDLALFAARKQGKKYIGIVETRKTLQLSGPVFPLPLKTTGGQQVNLFPLNWENYLQLKTLLPLSPVACDKPASFGTGDRLGLVSAAHLAELSKYPVFPVIAQQSPRELERTQRDFRDVLLKAVMGVIESGYTGTFGADADHIKSEQRFNEGLEAGYSMYTLDLSDNLRDISKLSSDELNQAQAALSSYSKSVISKNSGRKIEVPGFGSYEFSADELSKSAVIYEKSMEQAVHFNELAKVKLSSYDIEVSIDEGGRDTTPEDHLYVAEYLHGKGVDFKSLAPRFPGEFQKAVDYMGDSAALERSFNIHSQLARTLKGYRLSLHSGSDKFSVYPMYAKASGGNFHIKTSGTSWLQAVKLISEKDRALFEQLYTCAREKLPESKKAYHVYITEDRFPAKLPADLKTFLENPDVLQLLHISYGALLEFKREQIFEVLRANEERHYQLIQSHIGRHLELAFSK